MKTKSDKKKESFLDQAWRIAFDSMTYNVISNTQHSSEILNKAKAYIHRIDKSDWWPIADKLYDNGETYDEHALAEEASTIFINRKMETSGLVVTLGGDY